MHFDTQVDWAAGLMQLRQSASAKAELKELCDALLDRVNLHTDERPLIDDLVGARHTQTGGFWIEASKTEVFFVTLDKSEKAFSPRTRYEDFALSPTRFHWQSHEHHRRELCNWPAVRASGGERR